MLDILHACRELVPSTHVLYCLIHYLFTGKGPF